MPKEYKHDMPSGKLSLKQNGALLYILPAPLFIKLVIVIFQAKILPIIYVVAALFFFYSGAHMTRTTLARLRNHDPKRRQKLKDERLLAAVYITVGVAILMMHGGHRLPLVFVMVSSAFMGYTLLYGLSDRSTPTTPPIDEQEMPSATRQAIKAAYADLETIESLGQALKKNNENDMAQTLDKVLEQSYVIMDLLVKTPEDAGRARRFLNVYINRIKEILTQYLKLAQHGKADDLRSRLNTTLVEVEQAFREKKSQLLDDDIFKLDIQLEVLDEQIKHED